MAWDDYRKQVLAEWRTLLDHSPEERTVQEFLELHPAMIPGGSGDVGPGGHHGSEMGAVFREPELKGLGRNRYPDFMWVTHSTSLITPILLEIEKPAKRWFTKKGQQTANFTTAHDQLAQWKAWFANENNAVGFRERYLFKDAYRDRTLAPQYMLIYGRSMEFEPGGGHSDPASLRVKRDLLRRENEYFMTFDSLKPRYDHANSMTLTMTSAGPKIFAFSPVFGTNTDSGSDAYNLGSPVGALKRSVMMSDARTKYLQERWDYWGSEYVKDLSEKRQIIRGTGIE